LTKHKIMITVKKIEYYYRNWIVVLTDNIITFTCTLTLEGEGSKRLVREYYLPVDIMGVSLEGEYISVEHGKRLTKFKLEGDSCVVGDVWEDDDVVDSIAMHDFWDDFDI